MHCIRIASMNRRDAAATKVFEAMKMEAACVDGLAEKEAMHQNNYRALFETGALKPLMEFLPKREIVQGAMGKLVGVAHIPIEMMKGCRPTLHKDPTWRPYSQPANISKRALTEEQEQKLGERLRSDYIHCGTYCPGYLMDIMARREWEQHLKERKEAARNQREMQTGILKRDDEEYRETAEERVRKFKVSRTWRKRFLGSQRLSSRKPHARRRPSEMCRL
jgi:hypothetical protein